jgi:hypothetical protein
VTFRGTLGLAQASDARIAVLVLAAFLGFEIESAGRTVGLHVDCKMWSVMALRFQRSA